MGLPDNHSSHMARENRVGLTIQDSDVILALALFFGTFLLCAVLLTDATGQGTQSLVVFGSSVVLGGVVMVGVMTWVVRSRLARESKAAQETEALREAEVKRKLDAMWSDNSRIPEVRK